MKLLMQMAFEQRWMQSYEIPSIPWTRAVDGSKKWLNVSFHCLELL